MLVVVYCYEVLNYVRAHDSHYFFFDYLLHSYTFPLYIRLFLECTMSILFISIVASNYFT